MKYKLNEDRSFRCGVSCFKLTAGSVVCVRQKDSERGKVLIDFGDGYIDWYPARILEFFSKDN